MTDLQFEESLSAGIAALQKLTPLNQADALALVGALTGAYSLRELAEVMHRLTGGEWRQVCQDVLDVLAGQLDLEIEDVTRMRQAALAAGWRPHDHTLVAET